MGLTPWGCCCMVLEKHQHNAFHFLRKGNLYKFWTSSGILKRNKTTRDFSPYDKIPGRIGQRSEITGQRTRPVLCHSIRGGGGKSPAASASYKNSLWSDTSSLQKQGRCDNCIRQMHNTVTPTATGLGRLRFAFLTF